MENMNKEDNVKEVINEKEQTSDFKDELTNNNLSKQHYGYNISNDEKSVIINQSNLSAKQKLKANNLKNQVSIEELKDIISEIESENETDEAKLNLIINSTASYNEKELLKKDIKKYTFKEIESKLSNKEKDISYSVSSILDSISIITIILGTILLLCTFPIIEYTEGISLIVGLVIFVYFGIFAVITKALSLILNKLNYIEKKLL